VPVTLTAAVAVVRAVLSDQTHVQVHEILITELEFWSPVSTVSSGLDPPHFRGLTITPVQTTLSKTPLDE